MKADNEWHPGIIVEHADGSFGVYEDFEDAENNHLQEIRNPKKFQDIKYNWNRGQPIVDFGDFKLSIVDMDKK